DQRRFLEFHQNHRAERDRFHRDRIGEWLCAGKLEVQGVGNLLRGAAVRRVHSVSGYALSACYHYTRAGNFRYAGRRCLYPYNFWDADLDAAVSELFRWSAAGIVRGGAGGRRGRLATCLAAHAAPVAV